MIPARLKIENFMCFSNIDLDFAGLKIACLTGPNGAGKSSILDAMTWALWEQARSTSDKLIKLGSKNMSVEFEFIMDGVRYKIYRYYKKGALNNPRKPSRTNLELFYYDDRVKSWQPSTAKSIKETQDKVASIIKMEYDAFINSVYIKQGDVGSFLRSAPEERKSIFATILGLGEYDKLYKQSIKKAEEIEAQAKLLKDQINEGETRQFTLKKFNNEKKEILSRINTLQGKITAIQKDRGKFESGSNQQTLLEEKQKFYCSLQNKLNDDIKLTRSYISSINESISQLNNMISLENVIKLNYENYQYYKEKAKELDQKELEYHKLKDRLIEFGSKQMIKRYSAEYEYKKISETLEQKLYELEKYRETLAKSEKIQKTYLEYKDLTEKINSLEKFKLELTEIELKISNIQNKINEKISSCDCEIRHLKDRISQINQKLEKKDELVQQITFIEEEIKQYDKYEAELERIREKGLAQREVVIDKTNKNAFLEIERDRLKNKISKLQENNVPINCPTCDGSVLKPEDVIRKMEFEIDNLMIQVESNENDVSIAEDEIKFYRVAYKEKKKYLSQRTNYIFQLAELKTELKTIELDEQQLSSLEEQLKEYSTMTGDEKFAEQEKYEIKLLSEKKSHIEDILADFNNMKRRLSDISYAERDYNKLNEAREKAEQIETELSFFTMSKRTLEKELQKDITKPQNELAKDAYAKLNELQYDLEEHIELRKDIASSQETEYKYIKLQFAKEQLPLLEENLAKFESKLKEYNAEAYEIEGMLDEVNKEIANAQDYKFKYTEVSDQYQELSSDLIKYNLDLAVLNERIRAMEEALEEVRKKRIELDKKNKDIAEYYELSNILGKKGLQDIIIENSLAEVETEANKLLDILSDNDMRVSLRSSKSTKTNTYNDRLDIYIADSQGTRNSELFSSGESFIINFALRIALSKLLAKSRGFKLQTLIIDDAFGGQDYVSQKKLANTIKMIQDEFEMILIVSHVDELNNIFQSRIEISKDPAGSIARVVA